MKDGFIKYEKYSTYDSAVNYIEVTEKEMDGYIYSEPKDYSKLTPFRHPIAKMKLNDTLKFHNVTYQFQKGLIQSCLSWTRKNKLNWKFSTTRKFDLVTLKRIK